MVACVITYTKPIECFLQTWIAAVFTGLMGKDNHLTRRLDIGEVNLGVNVDLGACGGCGQYDY